MKRFLRVYVIALTFLCLLAGQCLAAAGDFDAPESWDITKSISLVVKSDYVNEILENGAGAFDFQLNSICITGKTIASDMMSLKLLVLFADEAQRDSALPLLEEDVRFTDVKSNAPTEVINTLRLQADSDTVKVGETLTLRPDGELTAKPPIGELSYKTIEVMIDGYDPQHEYTPADFPQYAFTSVEKVSITENNAVFHLELEAPGYYNFYRAIHALALDSSVLYVDTGEYIAVPDAFVPSEWRLSDTSVAEFTTSVPGENGEIVLRGLKAGKVTVTYVPSLGGIALGEDYAVTCDITVIDNVTAPETTEPGDVTDETTTPETTNPGDAANETTGNNMPENKVPQTGDQGVILSLIGFVSLLAISVLGIILYKKKNCR